MGTCFEINGFQRANVCRKSVDYYKDGNTGIRLPKDGKRRFIVVLYEMVNPMEIFGR